MVSNVVEEQDARGLTRLQVLKGGAGIVGSVGLMGLIIGCGDSSSSNDSTGTSTDAKAKAKPGGTLKVGLPGTSADTLDPGKIAPGGGNACLAASVYERLCTSNSNFEVRPALAEKWEANADGSEWTFHIRPGAVFSDGSPVTADDVKAVVDYVLDEKTGSSVYSLISASLKPKGVEVVDDATIKFTLTSPNGQFPNIMAERNLGIVKKGTGQSKQPVGAGPFMVKSFTAGQSWSVVKNPKYWDTGFPLLDGVECVVNNDASTVLRSITSGATDFGGIIDFGQAAEVKSGNAQLLENKNAYFIYAILDQEQKPFDNPKVREAVKIAVDRQAVTNSAFAGYGGLTSDIWLWPENPAYPEGLGVREQDIEKAKGLLSEAGYPNGIDLTLYTAPAYGGMVDFATALGQVVEPAGIRVKIQQTDPGSYWTKIEFQKPFYISTIGARAPLLGIKHSFQKDSPLPEPHYNNEEVNRLTAEAIATVDEAERNALTGQALQIISDEAGISVPAALPQLYAAKKGVTDIELDPQDLARFTKTYIA